MAEDSRKIVIEIKESSSGSKPNPSTPGNTNTTVSESTISGGDIAKVMFSHQVVNGVKNQVVQVAEYEFNKHFTLSENYMLENTYKQAKSYIKGAVSFGSSLVAGYMMGGGGVTGLIGATLFGSLNLVSTGIRYSQSREQQAISIAETNYNTNFSAERLGLSSGSRGTEN